ncbi:zinc ribbon domain-containing protein [Halovenus rubra]|uniref:Zinc ribbon domain-containing protein n=2 Tax=Halovenus rubra TaxID=869890 RepID=A0ACC7E3F3_9EURY|nr:zinc ribbon domain-containing protein [Halovenus rubra]
MSDSASEHSHPRKRSWLALLLTILVPGLGHVYLRLWLRSALWFALYITATSFVLPSDAVPDGFSVDAFVTASEAVALQEGLLILGISAVCLIDVYMMTNYINRRARRASGEAQAVCPHCGKEIDEELNFCHWCTTELDEPSET